MSYLLRLLRAVPGWVARFGYWGGVFMRWFGRPQ
jgi:hypothetical protein